MSDSEFELPADYHCNPVRSIEKQPNSYWTYGRLKHSKLYQWHVYKWASRLIRENGYDTVLDLGCGPGVKLHRLIYPYASSVYGVDQESAVKMCRELMPRGEFYEADLVEETRLLPPPDLVIACDVIEHLDRPDLFLARIREHASGGAHVLISTPDRGKMHGEAARTPINPAHVREWTRVEFVNYLEKNGFDVEEYQYFPPVLALPNLLTLRLLFRQVRRQCSWRYNLALLCKVQGARIGS